MYLVRNIFRKWSLFIVVFWIFAVFSITVTSGVLAGESKSAEGGIVGRVTSITSKYIEVDGIKYRLGKKVVVLDERGNLLPRKSLRTAVKVRLEEKNGEVNVIRITVKAE